jgi:vitamin B12 transporter
LSLWIQEKAMKALIKYIVMCIILICFDRVAIAQGIKDSIVELKTVPVLSNASGKKEGVLINKDDMKLDMDYQTGKRLSDILGENTSVFIKNYGVGQLSSISINGSSAAQTAILWNGIKINNSNTGQVDLALFDMGTVDNLSVTNTANNQYLGGALALNNNHTFNKDTLISNNVIRYGSFNTLNLSSNNIYSIGMFSGSTKINYLSSANDFPFVNNTQIGAPVQTQVNAATTLLSFLQQLDLRIKNFNVGAIFWLTDADRQLPPTMTEANTFEREWDKSYRSLAYLNGRKGCFSFSLKASYLYDWLRYTSPIGPVDSRSSAQAIRNLFNVIYSLRGLYINGTVNYDHEQAASTGFDAGHSRDISGINIFASYPFLTNRFWHISTGISAKQDMLGVNPLPFSPGAFISIGKEVKKSYCLVKLSGARAYRLPSLNDLYWYPGGNPNLQPEHAWNSSLGLDYIYMRLIKLNVNGFYNYVTDWIQWEPIPNNTSIWTAKNFKRVTSRGVNVSIKAQNKPLLSDKGFVVVVYAGYSYTNTISLDAASADDDSKDKQLIYVPMHNFSASLQLQYRRYYIRTIHSYTGVRYTATDDSEFLPGYYLTHLEAGKDFYFNHQQIGLSFRACNITNRQYQVINGTPMPGRSYEITARLNLSK